MTLNSLSAYTRAAAPTRARARSYGPLQSTMCIVQSPAARSCARRTRRACLRNHAQHRARKRHNCTRCAQIIQRWCTSHAHKLLPRAYRKCWGSRSPPPAPGFATRAWASSGAHTTAHFTPPESAARAQEAQLTRTKVLLRPQMRHPRNCKRLRQAQPDLQHAGRHSCLLCHKPRRRANNDQSPLQVPEHALQT